MSPRERLRPRLSTGSRGSMGSRLEVNEAEVTAQAGKGGHGQTPEGQVRGQGRPDPLSLLPAAPLTPWWNQGGAAAQGPDCGVDHSLLQENPAWKAPWAREGERAPWGHVGNQDFLGLERKEREVRGSPPPPGGTTPFSPHPNFCPPFSFGG